MRITFKKFSFEESMLGRRDRMVWNAYPDTIVGKSELFQFSTVLE